MPKPTSPAASYDLGMCKAYLQVATEALLRAKWFAGDPALKEKASVALGAIVQANDEVNERLVHAGLLEHR
jgi:hypothetical protein